MEEPEGNSNAVFISVVAEALFTVITVFSAEEGYRVGYKYQMVHSDTLKFNNKRKHVLVL